ncbi:Ger(x)C family spore germination protein [Brevibacillus fluminis]|uniref:Ger(x)C family spore germination protein n=1 Tax=Brevibacillus fluminis TaxID=511487 RepID=UPI003F8BA3B3
MRAAHNISLKKRGVCMFITCVLALLCGCEPSHVLDETGLITVIGFDQLGKGLYRGTASIPVVNTLAKQKVQVVSGKGITLRGIVNEMDLQLDRKPRLGQLRVILYGEEMAKNGLISFVQALDRTEVGSRPYLAVVAGKSYDFISESFPEQGNIGLYLYYTIFKNVRGEQLPSPTLHEFLRAYYSEGSDPYLPYIVRKGDDIKVKGLALFRNDRYVDWVKPQQTFYIKLLRDQFRTGLFQASIPKLGGEKGKKEQGGQKLKEIPIVLDTLSSKTETKLISPNPPVFQVSIHIRTRLAEIDQKLNLENQEVLDEINQAVSKKMVQEMDTLVAFLKKNEVDPIGFGEQYRAQLRTEDLTKEQWRKVYKQAKISFQLKMDIIRSSITN